MNKWAYRCACLALLGVGVVGYNYWSFSSLGHRNANEPENSSVESRSDESVVEGPREPSGNERARNVRAALPSASSAKDGVREASDVSQLSSEEALKRATARLALAKQSGELLPMDLDDVVALQRQMKDKDRTISIQQVQELLSSRDVDTSALALPE